MHKLLLALAIAVVVTGCAGTLPTCDGKHRRPINVPDRAEAFHPSCGTAA